jgi:hypothetical protein
MEVVITVGLDATPYISCSAKHFVEANLKDSFRVLTTGGLIALDGYRAVLWAMR